LIKINLLAVDRSAAKRKPKFQLAQKLTVLCSLILVAAALGIGWWYWSLEGAKADLQAQIEEAQRERQRLQNVIQQVQQFEARRVQLQQRVSLIEQLRKDQTGPVRLLDQISRALPDSMWLTDLRQTGTELVIDGRCTSLTSLSDFVSGLEGSNLFERPVEIVDSRVEPATATTPELIRFSVRAKSREGASTAASAN
jgi:type IV pilus assembly protein PilN